MSRSVSVYRNAVASVYIDVSTVQESWQWEDFVDYLRGTIISHYPSFHNADRWADREDHIILENHFAVVTVSEYCGLAAVCIGPDEYNKWPWAEARCRQVAVKFIALLQKSFGSDALQKIGTASNGEAFFHRLKGNTGEVITSKGERF
jgi:hypothetical protein